MPRYFFNTANGHVERDTEGEELRNGDAAQGLAVRYLGDILRDNPPDIWGDGEFRVDVTDEAGLILYSLTVIGMIAPAARPF